MTPAQTPSTVVSEPAYSESLDLSRRAKGSKLGAVKGTVVPEKVIQPVASPVIVPVAAKPEPVKTVSPSLSTTVPLDSKTADRLGFGHAARASVPVSPRRTSNHVRIILVVKPEEKSISSDQFNKETSVDPDTQKRFAKLNDATSISSAQLFANKDEQGEGVDTNGSSRYTKDHEGITHALFYFI